MTFQKIILLLIALFYTTIGFGQVQASDTLFYKNDGSACVKGEEAYYKLYFQEPNIKKVTEKTFYKNHAVRTISYFKNEKLIKKTDSSLAFYENGSLHWTQHYDQEGNPLYLKQLHLNGTIKRIEKYNKGQLSKRKKYDENGKRVRFTKFQKSPTYKGGYERMIAYLNRTIRYPAQAKDLNEHGTVIVSFIVTKDGKVEKPIIEKSIHPLLDQEALRVVGIMRQWSPGRINDQKINTRMSIPITFGLPNAGDEIPNN